MDGLIHWQDMREEFAVAIGEVVDPIYTNGFAVFCLDGESRVIKGVWTVRGAVAPNGSRVVSGRKNLLLELAHCDGVVVKHLSAASARSTEPRHRRGDDEWRYVFRDGGGIEVTGHGNGRVKPPGNGRPGKRKASGNETRSFHEGSSCLHIRFPWVLHVILYVRCWFANHLLRKPPTF